MSTNAQVRCAHELRKQEGGFDFKTSIIGTMILALEENPDAKESGLAHLCKFIEDCEHTSLAVRILHLLGKESPQLKTPLKYIRFIQNCVILENATICSCAVQCVMSRFVTKRLCLIVRNSDGWHRQGERSRYVLSVVSQL